MSTLKLKKGDTVRVSLVKIKIKKARFAKSTEKLKQLSLMV